MDGQADPDPAAEFAGETSWSARPDSDSVNYLFSSDRESSILGDFGWNFVPLQSTDLDRFGELHRIEAEAGCLGFSSECSGAGAQDASGSGGGGGPVGQGSSGSGGGFDVSASNPSVSSSSSEDPPEKSMGSGGRPPEIPGQVKKKGQQRIRQPRFAFMTKSDVDHLEDGYRWRKYGQKAVKNSPFPRSYYRCTNSKCTVKKRVERSPADPTIVITTYEGQHCHHGIGFPRGGIITHEGAFASHLTPQMTQFYYPSILSPGEHPSSIMTQSQQAPVEVGEFSRPLVEATTPRLSTDEGLLGDIVRPGMNNRR